VEVRGNGLKLSHVYLDFTLSPDAIMGEVLNVIVAFAVIVFAVRWATKGLPHSPWYFLLVSTLFSRQGPTKRPRHSLGFPSEEYH